MSKLIRLNSHHLINNFPEGSSLLKKTLGRLAFLLLVTKVIPRKNYLTSDDYQEALGVIKRGDIILAGGFRTVSRFFLGKLFTHSLLYQGNGECIHADADGVDTVGFDELFNEYDNLAILRPDIDGDAGDIIEKALAFANDQTGKPYDFYFEQISDRHYCTALINTAFSQAGFDTGLKINKDPKRPILIKRLRRAVKAESFLYGNFRLTFISRSLQGKESEIEKMARKRKNISLKSEIPSLT